MHKLKRPLALLLALLLVFGVLFGFGSAFLLVRYPGHNCCGQRCLFCEVLALVDVLLHQSGALLGVSAVTAVLLAPAFSRIKRIRLCRFVPRTPIVLKTKLLN